MPSLPCARAVEGDALDGAKFWMNASRRAVAEAVRYYRELGIYDLYRRDVPADAAWLQAIAREELAVPEEAVLAAAQGRHEAESSHPRPRMIPPSWLPCWPISPLRSR